MPNRILFFAPDAHKPMGGVKVIYKHVDILQQHGYPAYVLHTRSGFRCPWFPSQSPVLYLEDFTLHPDDLLVLPEVYNALFFNDIPPAGMKHKLRKWMGRKRERHYVLELVQAPVDKVIFNQNSYYTFHNFPFVEASLDEAYRKGGVRAIVVVSENNRQYLQQVLPDWDIYRTHNAIDTRVFAYAGNKKKQICFMPRKHAGEAVQVLNMLSTRGALAGFGVVSIDGLAEAEVAAIMRESLLFLSFGYPEGSPLPPAEAMSCGCVVAGYHGWGGREYFRPEFSYPVEPADVVGFAATVQKIIGAYQKDPDSLIQKGKMASEFIGEYFSEEKERQDVLDIWESILTADLTRAQSVKS